MTRDEAEKIAFAIGFADSGCASCVSDLCEELNRVALGWSFERSGDSKAEPDPLWPPEDEMARTREVVIVTEVRP